MLTAIALTIVWAATFIGVMKPELFVSIGKQVSHLSPPPPPLSLFLWRGLPPKRHCTTLMCLARSLDV